MHALITVASISRDHGGFKLNQWAVAALQVANYFKIMLP